MIIGALIFIACLWAVFSRRVDDGFIGRHLLTFAAIAGAGYAYSGEMRALLTAYILLLLFMLWIPLRHVVRLCHATKR